MPRLARLAMTIDGDVRRPAVAGRFYPGGAVELDAEVERLLASATGATAGTAGARSYSPRARVAVLAPHAGYVYSGEIAARVFAATEVPRRVIVLAPNHTGRGKRGAVWSRGAFQLPGGEVPVDEQLCARLLDGDGDGGGVLEHDRDAHRLEHALEVELPFLRARRADVRIAPIVLGPLALDECLAVGARLARAVAAEGGEVLVVASSDMSHYLTDEATRAIDRRALEPLLALDAARLYRTVRDEEISMCGVVPATAMIAYARARGATRAELCGYATSGDAFGERDRVVGYAGVLVDYEAKRLEPGS